MEMTYREWGRVRAHLIKGTLSAKELDEKIARRLASIRSRVRQTNPIITIQLTGREDQMVADAQRRAKSGQILS